MAFTGRAIYDTDGTNTVWGGIAEDVSSLIGMISPAETPLLDALGDATFPARSVYHEWLEESFRPNTITSSTAASTSGTAVMVHDGAGLNVGDFMMAGAILKDTTTGEYLQVASTGSSTIVVTRAFGGTTAGDLAAGNTLTVIADAALEGADVGSDVSKPRVRTGNYCQIFKTDIVVSGTEQAVTHIGVDNEYQHQKNLRLREALRDLEKSVILSKSSGNTIGSSTAYRSFKGLWDFISTNSTSVATLSVSVLEDSFEAAWGYGANDLDLIVCDATWKRVIDNWNTDRVQVANMEGTYRNRTTMYEGTFGAVPVLLNRWMPTKSLMILSTQRVNVLPLQGRSFRHEEVSKTGDSAKGMIIGEMTLEVKNEYGMAKIYG